MKPYRGDFGPEEAAHLLRRAAFAPAPGEVATLVPMGLEASVEKILGAEDPSPLPDADALDRTLRDSNDIEALVGAWLLRLGTTAQPLRETMVLLLHNHFVSALSKVRSGRMMLDQIGLFRNRALGDFEELARDMTRDPAMVRYLDLERSDLTQPNENFARELMELFTMGAGPYTEHDIQEAARAFTGYQLRGERFHFSKASHDPGSKTVLGKTGPLMGDDVVHRCVQHPATSRFLAGKLARQFVDDEPTRATIEEIAAVWRRTGGNLRQVLRALFMSEAFYDPRHRFRVTRSPAALAAAVMRSLQLRPPLKATARLIQNMGQTLLDPPTVKGYEGGAAWLNPASWLARRSFLLGAEAEATGKGFLATLSRNSDIKKQVATLFEHLMGTPPPAEQARRIEETVRARGRDGERHLIGLLLCHPRFQRS